MSRKALLVGLLKSQVGPVAESLVRESESSSESLNLALLSLIFTNEFTFNPVLGPHHAPLLRVFHACAAPHN